MTLSRPVSVLLTGMFLATLGAGPLKADDLMSALVKYLFEGAKTHKNNMDKISRFEEATKDRFIICNEGKVNAWKLGCEKNYAKDTSKFKQTGTLVVYSVKSDDLSLHKEATLNGDDQEVPIGAWFGTVVLELQGSRFGSKPYRVIYLKDANDKKVFFTLNMKGPSFGIAAESAKYLNDLNSFYLKGERNSLAIKWDAVK
jgi:hypothetical protein